MAHLIRKICLVIFAVVFFGVFTPFMADGFQDNAARSLATLKKVDDFPLFSMQLFGDYGFDAFLKQGISGDFSRSKRSLSSEAEFEYQCTCFVALNEKRGRTFGRNFDWNRHPALLLFTDPPNGYASVSMVDISYLGFSSETVPNSAQKKQLLEAPYYPFDGMNEWGLAVGMSAIPYSNGVSDSNKKTLGSLHVIRLMLDHAKNVEEALALLRDYDVLFREVPIHYLVADSSEHSAIIEYIDGSARILHNQDSFQVMTNFVITDTPTEQRMSQCWRYSMVFKRLKSSDGALSNQEPLNLLQDVSQPGERPTIWSIVYDMSSGKIQIVMDRKFEREYEFKLNLR